MEALGDARRGAIPHFESGLAKARKVRDQLKQERRAARPARWRLVEAERLASTKAAVVERHRAELVEMRAKHAELAGDMVAEEAGFASAQHGLVGARAAVAGIRRDIGAPG